MTNQTDTAPTQQELHTLLWENTVRIGRMWPFPGGAGFQELLEDLDDDQLPEEFKMILASWPEEMKDELFEGSTDAFEEFCAAGFRAGMFGWFGEVHTPVVTPFGNGGSFYHSWGHYHVGYLFAPTADAFMQKAAAWAEECEAEDKAKKTANG